MTSTIMYIQKVNLPKGFWAVSKPQSKPDDLIPMQKFIEGKGIETRMVQDKNGQFILYRNGVEAKTHKARKSRSKLALVNPETNTDSMAVA